MIGIGMKLIVFAFITCCFLSSCGLSLSLSRPPSDHPDAEDDNIWSEDHEDALAFLMDNLPPPEQSTHLSKLLPLLYANVRMAMKARKAHRWAKQIPWELFLEYVLPHSSLDEPRDGGGPGSWRGWMMGEFSHLIKGATSVNEAAMLLNQHIWELYSITFKAGQTPLIMSPNQVMDARYAPPLRPTPYALGVNR